MATKLTKEIRKIKARLIELEAMEKILRGAMRADLAKAQIEHRKRGRPFDKKPYNVRLLTDNGEDVGNGAGYLLRRLPRDHESFLNAYEASEGEQ
jgi:hypothetical protein